MMGPGARSMMQGMSGGGIDALEIVAIVIAVLVLFGVATLITIRVSHRQLPRTGGPDPLLASDRARDRAVAVLADAYTTGHLTREELEHRTRLALSARTRAELGRLTQDVPQVPERD